MRTLSSTCAVLLTLSTSVAQPESRFVLVSGTDRSGMPLLGLQAEDFKIENGGLPCDVVNASPAAYPVALVIDTSSFARSDFQSLRHAVQRFVNGLERPVAVYTSGAPVTRLQGFTRDRDATAHAVDQLFAWPNSTTHTLATVQRAAADLRTVNAPVSAIVVVSAGGVEMNPPSVRDLLEAVLASHSILHAVDGGTQRSRSASRPQDLGRRSDVLEALVHRTHGAYERGVDATVYSSGLEDVRRQLDGEVIVEYAVPPSAPRELRLGLRLPGTLARAIALDHAP